MRPLSLGPGRHGTSHRPVPLQARQMTLANPSAPSGDAAWPRPPTRPELDGRAAELAVIDRLLAAARAGRGGALAIRGEPGIGKSALLADAGRRAGGLRVLHAAGVEGESRLAFAALQQLLHPLLGRTDRLPGPQAQALRVAVGLEAGRPPTGSWWPWPPSPCCRRRPGTGRCCAWSTTGTGPTRPRWPCSASWPAASTPNRWPCWSPWATAERARRAWPGRSEEHTSELQ